MPGIPDGRFTENSGIYFAGKYGYTWERRTENPKQRNDMKSVKESLLERRSIRRYEREKIEQEKLDFIFEAIRNTPTSYNGQQFSVIAITDQSVKEELYAITGQKQIKTSAAFLVFCLDYHKLKAANAAKGLAAPDFAATIDGYTVGVIDASMAMMSAVAAAESLGLGCCCVGYIRTADPRKVSDMLGLPQGVAIVCGLTLGYPREMPDLKPKLPVAAVVHKEHYTPDETLVPALEAYDREVTSFNASRSGDKTDNDWAGHIADYHRHSMEHGIRDYLAEQIGLDR